MRFDVSNGLEAAVQQIHRWAASGWCVFLEMAEVPWIKCDGSVEGIE